MKKTLVLVMIAVLCVALCGCATVRYSVVISDNGARTYDFSVIFDETVDVDNQDIQTVKAYFSYYASKNPYSEYVFDENNPPQMSLRISYENVEEYYLAMGVTGDETGDSLEGVSKGLFKVYTQTLFEKADFVSYAISFLANTDVDFQPRLKTAFLSNVSGAESEIKSAVMQIVQADDFLGELSSALADSEYYEKIADYSFNCLKSAGYDFDKITFYLDYSHCYDSIKGVDPDEVGVIETESGKKQKVYTWQYDPSTTQKIQIEQTAPNTWIWELIAIIFGLAVGGTCVAVFIIQSKKNKNKIIAVHESTDESDINDSEDLFSDSEVEKLELFFSERSDKNENESDNDEK